MSKVLGGVSCDKKDCLDALNITDWNVHKASRKFKLTSSVLAGSGNDIQRIVLMDF